MANVRVTLTSLAGNLEESMGVRSGQNEFSLAPVAQPRDVGRLPARQFGRIAIDQVMPDPDQPRAEFAEEAIDRLSASIKDQGQLMPIRVRWSDAHARWVIVFGERRWRAARRAGLAEIDCFFHDNELTAEATLEQQLVENCLREDLRPIEEARAFARLMEAKDWTGKQLAEALRVSESRVSRALTLLQLPDATQAMVDAGEIPRRTAYELARLDSEAARQNLVDRIAHNGVTAEQVAREARRLRGKPASAPRGTRQTFLTEDGWRIHISSSKRGTYHDIEKALNEALEDVRLRINYGRQL